MPDPVFRVVLPLVWVLLVFGIAGHRRRVARRIGRDPVVIRPWETRGTVEAYLEHVLVVSAVLLTLDIAANAISPARAARMLAIDAMRSSTATGYAGLALLAVGFLIAATAIRQMGASWRIGIDEQAPGPVVMHGLYARIRHPIYSGMLLSATGIALTTADVISIAVAAVAWVAVPIQARAEEAFLLSRHGDEYGRYLQRTARFWPR